MATNRRDIIVGEPYQKDGQEKMSWNKLGTIFVGENGEEYAKWNTMPNQLLLVRKQKKWEDKKEPEL